MYPRRRHRGWLHRRCLGVKVEPKGITLYAKEARRAMVGVPEQAQISTAPSWPRNHNSTEFPRPHDGLRPEAGPAFARVRVAFQSAVLGGA